MESITSNLTSQIDRFGDIKLRYGRAAPYTYHTHAAPLPKTLVKCPKCLVVSDSRLHARCPADPQYVWVQENW